MYDIYLQKANHISPHGRASGYWLKRTRLHNGLWFLQKNMEAAVGILQEQLPNVVTFEEPQVGNTVRTVSANETYVNSFPIGWDRSFAIWTEDPECMSQIFILRMSFTAAIVVVALVINVIINNIKQNDLSLRDHHYD